MANKQTKETAGQPSQPCVCPYCECEVECKDSPFCEPCGVKLARCPSCKAVIEPDALVCRRCGKPVK